MMTNFLFVLLVQVPAGLAHEIEIRNPQSGWEDGSRWSM